MNQFLEALIAMMISLIPPGYSMYSQVPITYCDEECQQTKLCDDPSKWRCRTPILNSSRLNDLATDYASVQGVSYEEAVEYAKPYSFTRPETYEEGLARYYVIAKAARDVALKMNLGHCKSQCKNLTKEKEVISCHKRCLKAANWKWSRKEMEYLILTVIQLESGYRADVHGGTPPRGRGDCSWKREGKRAAAWSKGAVPIMSTCKSVCLGQINLGTSGRVTYMSHSWLKEQLPGIDYASTERCLTAVGKHLSRSRGWCTSHLAPRTNDWAAATLSMYGTGNICDSKKLMKRSGVFWRKYNHPTALQPKAKAALQDPAVQALIQKLMTAQQQILWMLPLPAASQPTQPQPSLLPDDLVSQLNESTPLSLRNPSPWTYTRPASLLECRWCSYTQSHKRLLLE